MSKRNSREGKARRRAERANRKVPVATVTTMTEVAALAAADPGAVLPCGCTAAHELETSKLMGALAAGMPLGPCDYGDCPAEATQVIYWRDPVDDREVSCFCGHHGDHVMDAHPGSVQTHIGGSG